MFVLALLIVGTSLSAMAQGPDAAPVAVTYTAGFQLQNLTGSTATVAIAFHNQDGSIAAR